MGCGFLRRMALLGPRNVSLGFRSIQILNTFLETRIFPTAVGSPDNNFLGAVFGNFFSLSFQCFLGVKNASEWWVGHSVRSAFSSSRNQVLSAADYLSHEVVRVGKRLSVVDEHREKLFQGRRKSVRSLVSSAV